MFSLRSLQLAWAVPWNLAIWPHCIEYVAGIYGSSIDHLQDVTFSNWISGRFVNVPVWPCPTSICFISFWPRMCKLTKQEITKTGNLPDPKCTGFSADLGARSVYRSGVLATYDYLQ